MLHAEVVDNGGMGTELNIALRVFYDSPDTGIDRLELRNRRGFIVFEDKLSNCPLTYMRNVEHLSASDAPFSLTIWRCQGIDGGPPPPDVVENLLPQHDLCGSGHPTPPTQACLDAQTQAVKLANTASGYCDQARVAHAERDSWAAAAAAAWVAFAALTAAAIAALAIPIVGYFLAVALFIAAAIFLGTAIATSALTYSVNKRYQKNLSTFNDVRQAYRDQMLIVRAACCPEQIHVPDLPDCSA